MGKLVIPGTQLAVASWLHDHDVFSVFEQQRGMDDDEVIDKAFAENRILITNDKGSGEESFRERRPSCCSCRSR